jgi:hypothetical protein
VSTELSELFDRDPLKLTDQDLPVIIQRMREAQAQYELGVKPKAPAAPKSSKTKDLLKDLGLDL